MPWIHLCRSEECWCQGRLYGEIVLKAGRESVPQPEWHSDAMGELTMAMKKRPMTGCAVPARNAWTDAGDKADFPNIYSFMVDQKYDDGSPRVPGAISIFTSQGVLKACINDKDNISTAFVEANTIHELIECIERAICDDATEWRVNPNAKRPTF